MASTQEQQSVAKYGGPEQRFMMVPVIFMKNVGMHAVHRAISDGVKNNFPREFVLQSIGQKPWGNNKARVNVGNKGLSDPLLLVSEACRVLVARQVLATDPKW